MTLEEYLIARDKQILLNETCRKHSDPKIALVEDSGLWVNAKYDELPYIFNHIIDLFNMNPGSDMVCSAFWYFNEQVILRIYELIEFTQKLNTDIQIFAAPENNILIFFKDKEAMNKNLPFLPKEYIENSIFNIKTVKGADNGVEFVYYNKSSFRPFDEGYEKFLTQDINSED